MAYQIEWLPGGEVRGQEGLGCRLPEVIGAVINRIADGPERFQRVSVPRVLPDRRDYQDRADLT
jgi:hypothetical protein